jgi:hypothetical protein
MAPTATSPKTYATTLKPGSHRLASNSNSAGRPTIRGRNERCLTGRPGHPRHRWDRVTARCACEVRVLHWARAATILDLTIQSAVGILDWTIHSLVGEQPPRRHIGGLRASALGGCGTGPRARKSSPR